MPTIKEIRKKTYREQLHPMGKYLGRPLSYLFIKLLVPFGVTSTTWVAAQFPVTSVGSVKRAPKLNISN